MYILSYILLLNQDVEIINYIINYITVNRQSTGKNLVQLTENGTMTSYDVMSEHARL